MRNFYDNINPYAPVVIFTYKRLNTLLNTINSLKLNLLAKETEVYIFSDGPKNLEDSFIICEIRKYLTTVSGFKSITVIEAKSNQGLANSIIQGVSHILNLYESVIVLEDDLITSPNFLSYMNQALEWYKTNQSVFSISGYSYDIKVLDNYKHDVYFTKRSSSWGWATWKDRWVKIDWKVSDYNNFIKSKSKRKDFNRMGSDLTSMLHKQMTGQINSWAIRWCYHQFKNNLFTVYPTKSKVQNIGFGTQATNTNQKFSRFKTTLESSSSTIFHFNADVVLDKHFIRQFVNYQSFYKRILDKVLNVVYRPITYLKRFLYNYD